MRKLALAAMAWLLMAATAMSETLILSAPEAQSRVDSGEMILLDIRSPQEWADTGVAKGAWPVSMHEPNFGTRLQAILATYPPEQIGLICATGGRTAHVIEVLGRNGITGVTDLSEGMMGNPRGPGWIARGMEVVTAEDAKAAYDAAAASW